MEQENHCRTWMEMRLKKFLEEKENVEDALEDISTLNYLVANYHPDVYCHIIKTSDFSPYDKDKEKYIFCFLTQLYQVVYLYISEETYDSFEEAKKQLHFYIKYFPYFAFMKRNILRQPKKTTL